MPHHALPSLNLHRCLGLCAAGTLATILSVATAFAAGGPAAGDAGARYSRERAACTDGTSQQDRATCLKEAGAALDEARRGRLGAQSTATEANATARCDALPAKDRRDCVARIKGAGTTSGSVREGGIYRELVTTTPSPPAMPPASAPSAAQD